MKKPNALKIGDAIGIVAPAGPISPELLKKGIERLRNFGFHVIEGKHLSGSYRYFSGTDQERAEDLQWMFQQDVRAIICARGGYGSSRLIPILQGNFLRKPEIIFIGCSDLTTLLLYFSRLEIPVFHGPMVSHFSRSEDALTNQFLLDMLISAKPLGTWEIPEIQVLREGRAEGRLTGGCLSLLCSSLGTSYEVETEGKVLFFEEVNEAPYRIDRMLTQLKQAGKLEKVKGILIGKLLNCEPPAGSEYTLKEILTESLEGLNCPVLSGLPFGHGNQNITLPFGILVRLDSSSGTLTFLESPVL
ncbi:MAG: LD-carboxypeptidase [Nitrospirae bacterium]|nr:LD-carboxypeptidase [Nitrospirota bacterium]MBI3593834.1 LD-carboxypeptidase [Nitrospirota bacterium]